MRCWLVNWGYCALRYVCNIRNGFNNDIPYCNINGSMYNYTITVRDSETKECVEMTPKQCIEENIYGVFKSKLFLGDIVTGDAEKIWTVLSVFVSSIGFISCIDEIEVKTPVKSLQFDFHEIYNKDKNKLNSYAESKRNVMVSYVNYLTKVDNDWTLYVFKDDFRNTIYRTIWEIFRDSVISCKSILNQEYFYFSAYSKETKNIFLRFKITDKIRRFYTKSMVLGE